ncbi:MAG: PhzF family phenazine biosynthesis protein [Haloarculaceae archaeon]
MPRDLHIVDVFARERYTGNQLAVVESEGTMGDEEMQAVAREMDFSETTFVESRAEPYRVRIFTPEAEVPFAGHPTLGTAHVVRERVADGRPEAVVLDLNVGQVPVEVRERDGRGTLWMTQQPPEFGETLAHDRLAAVLGLSADRLDTDWPVQVVSTGLPTVIVPLVDRSALTDIDLDRGAYDDLTGDREAKLVHAFCADPRDPAHDLAVRMFAPAYGVPEDPATGSANGCLAAYLARYAYFGSGVVDARVEQGHEVGRPSLLYLAATDRGDDVRVEVGGRVVDVARGELY